MDIMGISTADHFKADTSAESHTCEWDHETKADGHHRVHSIACDNIQETTTGVICLLGEMAWMQNDHH